MDVSLRLRLLQHDHGVGLPEEGAGGAQLSQLDQLQHHLCQRENSGHVYSLKKLKATTAMTTSPGVTERSLAFKQCTDAAVNLGPHLLIQVNQGLVGQLEGLDGLQDGVPVAAVYVGHKALDAVHRVERHRGLLLQTEQGPLQVVLLEVLHDQTDHAKEETGDHNSNNAQVYLFE